jgi:predicted transcriptional regulator
MAFKFKFEADKTFVEKAEPLQDKQNINDENKPEPMDVVAEILETSEKHLTPKQIANTANLNESTVRSCVKRLKDNPQSNIKMFKDGYGYVGKREELL